MDATAALMFAGVFTLTLLPLVMVYRIPEHNALDEAVAETRERRESRTMNLFQKAQAGLNLTPGERALLKLFQGFATAGVAAVVAAVPAVMAQQAGKPQITWGLVLFVAGIFVHGFMAAWQKYVSARGDQPLATAIGSVSSALDAAFGLNELVVEPPVPPVPPDAPDDGAPAQAQQPQAA